MNNQSLTVSGFNTFLSKVFGWMFVGLLLTAGTSFLVVSTPAIIMLLASNRFVFYGLLIGELVLVVVISKNALKYSYPATIGLFLLYSFLNGVTLSFIFLVYSLGTLFYAFSITAVLFGVMALYGYFTKTDLSPFRAFLFFAVIGIIIASIVNLFLNSGSLEYIISLIGVVIFAGLTAVDIQKMKSYYALSVNNQGQLEGNLAVSGALTLYLDFINMFLFVLRLVGRRN